VRAGRNWQWHIWHLAVIMSRESRLAYAPINTLAVNLTLKRSRELERSATHAW